MMRDHDHGNVESSQNIIKGPWTFKNHFCVGPCCQVLSKMKTNFIEVTTYCDRTKKIIIILCNFLISSLIFLNYY
jgi:hypothetical protein